jgi:flagellar biosynthesis/type III secretory pathway protein FliH
MKNVISLTLDAYKDKDLPLTIMINGNTYYSQYSLATAQTNWYEMGKEAGMSMGASSGVNEMELDIEWNEGYEAGKSEGYDEGYKTAYAEIEKKRHESWKVK